MLRIARWSGRRVLALARAAWCRAPLVLGGCGAAGVRLPVRPALPGRLRRCCRAGRVLPGGLVEHPSDLVLDGLLVGLLVHVDACVAGHPEKRLTGTLRIHDFLARRNDVEGTISGSLVGLTLMFGDNLGDFGDFE